MKIAMSHWGKHDKGYGRVGMEIEAELNRCGIETVPIDENQTGEVPALAFFVTQPTHVQGWWEGQHTVLLTMFETTKIPLTFRDGMGDFDQLLVPSDQNIELFSQYHPNVTKCPLGINPEKWNFRARPSTDSFVYLTAGTGPRKGNDLCVKAFRRVRDEIVSRGDPAPRLVFLAKSLAVADPDMQVINYTVSAEEEIEIYASAHCFLAPSRGEGWGLQPQQAMAQGMPTILTDAHGHSEYSKMGIKIPATLTKADYALWGDAGDWWEPDLEVLTEKMLWVYDNYEKASKVAEENAEWVKDLNWRGSVDEFVSALDDFDLLEETVPAETWRLPQIHKYRIVTKRPIKCDIGGATYIFPKGEERYASADVKRVMFEAGYLDESCIDEFESGLTEAQVEKSQNASNCPMCGQEVKCQT